jgi:hypothetical protein
MAHFLLPALRARERALEQSGLVPNPAIGQAKDSDGVIDYLYAVAGSSSGNPSLGIYKQAYQPGGGPFYFNGGQQNIIL